MTDTDDEQCNSEVKTASRYDGSFPRTDAELLHDREDSSQSFGEFYLRHFSAIMRFVASRSGGPDPGGGYSFDLETAADVVSETFMSALLHRHRYRPEYPTARLWLIRIAANKLVDAQRKRSLELKRHRLLYETHRLSEADYADFEAMVQQQEGPAVAALSDLPSAERRLIEQRILEDRNYADVAAELGLTEAAARKRLSRSLAALRTQLDRRDL